MANPSNLYAEKVYAEQPTALWSLDDDCTFVSYFSSADLDLSLWTPTGTAVTIADDVDPFAKIVNSSFVEIDLSANTTLTSPSTFSTSSNFSAGVWFNAQVAGRATSVVFKVGDGSVYSKTFTTSSYGDGWVYLEHVFEVTSAISSQNFSITINYGTPAGNVYLNGFSIGANQQFFGSIETGNHLQAITGSSFSGYGIPAYEYGIGERNGWYIGNFTTKSLYAKNFSMPLVYGARSSTVLYENTTGPSLMLPGVGFLNNAGRNNTITFEGWFRIKTDGNVQDNPFRILGPISSTDGLYVNGQHLILKVDGKFASHYVGEWFRPMLINIEYTGKIVVLYVNGERVASIDILETTVFPSNATDDFIGFYVGGNVDFVEVDCVAIYPYRVTPTMLKRRFGYAQAVQAPVEIETGYSGKQIAFDYTFAGYSSDYSYPMIESWSSSTKDNVYTSQSIMGSPIQSLPDIVVTNTDMTEADWIADNTPGPNIKMIPTSAWDTAGVYMQLNRIQQDGMLPVSSIFLAGKVNSSYSDRDQVILKIQNKETLDSISMILSGSTIHYVYNVFGEQGVLGTVTGVTTDFVAGLDFSALTNIPSEVVRFLEGVNRYSLFIGGDYSGNDQSISTTFAGTIYKLGLMSKNNFLKEGASTLFTNGIANLADFSDFLALDPTYGVAGMTETFGADEIYNIEPSSKSYWQDYLPLSKFAKTANDGSYVTDMIQFSIDSATSNVLTAGNINTSNLDVKSYIYFVNNTDIASLSSFGNELSLVNQPLAKSLVIDASDWDGKIFEVVDGAVIIPPQTNQSDISMVTLVEISTKSSRLYPIKIRSIEYAAQTFNRASSVAFDKSLAKKIGARSLTASAYMFSEQGGQFVYNGYNPISISKTSTPYLYLTNKSGIKVLDSYGSGSDRGIYLPVNESAAEAIFISLISMSILYNDLEFLDGTAIAEFYGSNYTNKIRLASYKMSNDASKAYLRVEHYTGTVWEELGNVRIYINGTYMAQPMIVAGEWATIGIYFASNSLDASGTSSKKIEIVGSCVVNNISYYQLRPEELAQQIIANEWNDYQTGIWDDLSGTWLEVYATESFIEPNLTPDVIFNIYTGTNKILSIEDGDNSGIGIGSYKYDILENIIWQPSVTITT